jgi:hypothetical protein
VVPFAVVLFAVGPFAVVPFRRRVVGLRLILREITGGETHPFRLGCWVVGLLGGLVRSR